MRYLTTIAAALALGAGMACSPAQSPRAAQASMPVQASAPIQAPATDPVLQTLDKLMQIPTQPNALKIKNKTWEAHDYSLRRRVARGLVYQLADAQGNRDGQVAHYEVCDAVRNLRSKLDYAADQYAGDKDGTATQEEMDALGAKVKTRQCPGLEEAIAMTGEYGCR